MDKRYVLQEQDTLASMTWTTRSSCSRRRSPGRNRSSRSGKTVKRRELLAKGVTKIYFQANVWIFAFFVVLLGSVWGVGKAAVYKHIPDYFPEEVGVVGGMVGVIGGLGGFVCPIIFGYLLETTGLWTSCWMFMWVISCRLPVLDAQRDPADGAPGTSGGDEKLLIIHRTGLF